MRDSARRLSASQFAELYAYMMFSSRWGPKSDKQPDAARLVTGSLIQSGYGTVNLNLLGFGSLGLRPLRVFSIRLYDNIAIICL